MAHTSNQLSVQTCPCMARYFFLSLNAPTLSIFGYFLHNPSPPLSPRMFLLNFQKSLDLLDTFLCGWCIGPHSGWFCCSMGIFLGGRGQFLPFWASGKPSYFSKNKFFPIVPQKGPLNQILKGPSTIIMTYLR